MPTLVTLDDVRSAAALLDGVARRTLLEGSRPLSDLLGGPVWLKCENLQRTGSFKLRGAYVRIARLAPAQRAQGVVAASAGNHAQGVALAAGMLGAPAVVFMPHGAPLPKVMATRAYGAQVRFAGDHVDDALAVAMSYADEHGATFIHPFDHPDLIAGQGSVGLEIVAQCPDVGTVVVGAGGGGLVSGIAAAVRGLRPQVRIVAVQAHEAAALPASLAAGRPVVLASLATMADGIAVGAPTALTLAHVAALVDEVVTVPDEALSRALLLCLERAKLVVEPAGAAGVAAILEHAGTLVPPVVAVLSGGNIDPVLLSKVIRHGMTSAGRYLSCRLRISDRPGELARLLGELASTGANVLDVEHRRTGPDLLLGDVEVAVSLEARGPGHCAEVLDRVRAAGYRLVDGR